MSKKPGLRKRIRRYLGLLGMVLGGLALIWWWVPWEYDFFPKAAPKPNPLIDPEKDLFQPDTRVMVVTAHPDDSEFYVGGTLTRLHESGAKLKLVVLTDGDKAYYGPFADQEKNRRIRQEEQRKAAKMWGADEVTFVGRPDGRLNMDDELVNEVAAEIDDFQPKFLMSFDPEYPPRRTHSDHRETGEIAAVAWEKSTARPTRLLFATQAPNWVFDIDKQWPVKEELLRTHASQFVEHRNDLGNRIFGRSGDPWPFIQGFVLQNAVEEGALRDLTLGEAVRVIPRG